MAHQVRVRVLSHDLSRQGFDGDPLGYGWLAVQVGQQLELKRSALGLVGGRLSLARRFTPRIPRRAWLKRPAAPLVFDSLLCWLFCALLHRGNNDRAIVLGPMKEQ